MIKVLGYMTDSNSNIVLVESERGHYIPFVRANETVDALGAAATKTQRSILRQVAEAFSALAKYLD